MIGDTIFIQYREIFVLFTPHNGNRYIWAENEGYGMKKHWKILLTTSLVLNLAIIYVGYKALEYRSHINFYLDKYTNVVAEFSRRSEFLEANKPLVSDTIVPGRVLLFGTQLVSNWAVTDGSGRFEFINRGVNSQHAAGLLLRFYQDVIALKPEYVVIEVSSYNLRGQWSLKETQEYMRSMAELASYHKIKLILTTMIPLEAGADEYENYIVTDSLLKQNDWLRSYAAENEFVLLDLYQQVADEQGNLRDELSAGPIDLNEAGYGVVTEELLNLLGTLD